jgi:hypothetical protein
MSLFPSPKQVKLKNYNYPDECNVEVVFLDWRKAAVEID